MSGPAPKDPSQRRRRKPPSGGDWITLPSNPYDGPKPRMPGGLSDASKAAWRAWWASPMAHEWIEADWANLVFLIRLLDQISATKKPPRASTLAEIRNWQGLYGLTPKSRRDLRWRIETDTDTETDTAPNRWATLQIV